MTTGTYSYSDLLQTFPPRPIATEEEYDTRVAQMNKLIDKDNLTLDEQDLLTLLRTLIAAYEDKQYPDELLELRGMA
ncbi:MAG: hypothetical protein GY803_10965 [Chloroflexi bacterium]|nr:hypothetical protein [Chloroflexota bacterium]